MEKYLERAVIVVSAIFFILGCSVVSAPRAYAGDAVTSLRFGTVNVGGTYYIVGTAFGQTINKFEPSLKINVEVTGGSVDNMKLMEAGDLELGLSTAPIAYFASRGEQGFKKLELNALTAINTGRAHVVTRKDSGINSIKDMAGKRISTAEPGSASETLAIDILNAAGIDENKDIKRQRINLMDSIDAIADGRCDALIYQGGIGIPSIVEITTTTNAAVLIDVEDEVVEKLTNMHSYYIGTEIPAGTYGNGRDLKSVGAVNHLLCKPELSEDAAYKIVSTLFEHRDDWVNAHSSCKEQTLDTATLGASVPFHPGAIKYYKEKGVWKE
jgi:TRAP transporter TAXI family solute receptor